MLPELSSCAATQHCKKSCHNSGNRKYWKWQIVTNGGDHVSYIYIDHITYEKYCSSCKHLWKVLPNCKHDQHDDIVTIILFWDFGSHLSMSGLWFPSFYSWTSVPILLCWDYGSPRSIQGLWFPSFYSVFKWPFAFDLDNDQHSWSSRSNNDRWSIGSKAGGLKADGLQLENNSYILTPTLKLSDWWGLKLPFDRVTHKVVCSLFHFQ